MALPNSEKITSQLASMPDQALKQMAMMHKADPYVLPLIISEDGRRKQMRAAAMARMAAPQPKVADAAVASVGSLPEDQGIAQLQAPNIQHMADGGIAGYDAGGMAEGGGPASQLEFNNEPVLRMAGGGMPGYAKGGLTEKQEFAMQYKDLAEKVGRELGVDPGIIISQWGLETGWGKKPVGDFNLGNIKDVTGKGPTAYDKMEKSKSSYKSYESPEAFAADYTSLIKRNFPNAVGAGSDIGAFSAGLQSGKKGAYATDPNYRKSLARTYDSLPDIIPSAQAAEAPKAQAAAPADTSLAAQIPGQSYIAPASNYDQTNSFFGRMADKMGIPLEAQRQIGTTLNAPTPLAPVVGSTKAGSGIAALGEKVAEKLGLLKGPPGSMSKAEIAALKNEQAGLRALENSQLAMKDAQSAGATLDEQEYLRKMIETRRAAEAPSKAAQIAEASQLREAGDVATAQRLAQTGERAQTAGRVDALADRTTPTPEAAPTLGADQRAPVRYDEFGPPNIGPETLDLSKKEMDAVAKDAKEATPVEARKGLTNDDYLMMGLSLLASKAPNFANAFGEAGVATLGAKRAREKDEREEAKLKGAEDLQKAQAKYYGAYAGAIERGAKEKNDELEAEKLVRQYMGDWEKNNKIASIQNPSARLEEEARIRQQIYTSLGLTPIMSKQANPASQSDPLGILNKR